MGKQGKKGMEGVLFKGHALRPTGWRTESLEQKKAELGGGTSGTRGILVFVLCF